MKGVNFTIVAK